MKDYRKQIKSYSEEYRQIITQGKEHTKERKKNELPGNTYFLKDGSILCIPRKDGDSRFPYGENGFNLWAYASGYIHANEGLFSPFLRAKEGQEPVIGFFAGMKEKETYDVLSLLAVPMLDEEKFDSIDRYTIFSKTCAYYITEASHMRFAIRVYVDGENHMYFTLFAENLSEEAKEFYLSAYLNPYLSNGVYETAENRWFRKAEYIKEDKELLGGFVFRINEDLSRTLSVTNYGVINQSCILEGESRLLKENVTTSRYEYVGGSYSSLHSSKPLKQGCFQNEKHITSFNETAIAGEILHFAIDPLSSIRMDLEVSYMIHSHNEEDYKGLIRNLRPEYIDAMVNKNEVIEEADKKLLNVSFGKGIGKDFNHLAFTNFFDYLRKQVEFCSVIKGYVQLSEGSLIGIRDVFQALEGMLFFKPDQAKDKILEALSFIDPTGRCPRQYALPIDENAMPEMDLRQFIDQGVWVINTIINYIKFTGDYHILEETCGYYEIVDDKRRVVKKSEIHDSVLSHILRIMEYLMHNQDMITGCVKALYGDWNDALDGLGVSIDGKEEFGNGVSVMVTLQFYQNLKEMIELLNLLSYDNSLIKEYENAMETIEEGLKEHAVIKNKEGELRIVHGWGDKKSYYVGGFCDPDKVSRHGLTSNAFWVISGMYEKDCMMKETILNAFSALDSRFGLKTFEPYFLPGTPGVGRIYKLPPGTAENGAAYIHASAFGIMALFMMGEAEEAWKQLMKILPFTHEKVSCSPYVMPNSYGDNVTLNIDGESMQDWQTGSSNVVFKILLRFVFGFQAEYQGFFIQPANWIPFNNYQVDLVYQGKPLHIRYENKGVGKRSFLVNGKPGVTVFDEVMNIEKLWVDKENLEDNIEIIIVE
ncbi:MAG: GH36-type glycosyl hydrolase domain-containing protein [Anaerocolumna sp.]